MNLKKIISIFMTSIFITGILPFNAMAAAKYKTISVGKGSEFEFNTIQDALNSIDFVPSDKAGVNIVIEPGVYEEEVTIDKPYVKFTNNNKSKDVVISYDKANGNPDPAKNFGTDKTATVTVTENAVGFEAHNITFKNSYNIGTEYDQTQAVALETLADKVALYDCKMIGRQDTLYLKGASKGQNVYGSANNARVYLKNCYIEGTVDFIFGDATAYFDSCNLYMAEYKNGGHFTAPNTTLFNIGYVFNNCKLQTSDKFTSEAIQKVDLGRPWQADAAYPNSGSNSVFINCTMPSAYNEAGFSLWDSNTIANKVRFYEYNSLNPNGSAVDMSKRASFAKVLTEEQAKNYNAYNVLSGEDNWSPYQYDNSSNGACEVTLDNYNVSVPLGETYQLKAFTLPVGRTSNIKYTSDNTDVATVDENGLITGVAMGSANISATLENGLATVATVNVTAQRTQIPEIKSLKITSNSNILVGNIVKADYSYMLESDNAIDAACIRWYAIKDGKEYLIKDGVGEYFKSYTVQSKDIGYQLKVDVLPATTTTYGVYGNAVTYKTPQSVASNTTGSNLLLRENFDNGTNGFVTDGQWNKINNGYNSFVSANSSDDQAVSMLYSGGQDWNNIKLDARYRFNPTEKGLSSAGEFNIYFNHSDSGYYRLKLGRGSNTKSLKLYLYKKTTSDEQEVLLASDESSLKNNIYQNAGEDNPYFNISIVKNNGNITVEFRLEDGNKKLAELSANDTESNLSGTIGFSAVGDPNVVLIDNVSVEGYDASTEQHKTRLFLLGDSTAKNYGDDNTIGGWGEYLVNYFDSNVEIINKAEGGRSARSYLNQGRLKEVTDQLTPEDYVFVQFGTNDQRTDDNAFMEHAVVLGEPDADGIYPTNPALKTKTPQRIYDFYKDTEYPYEETFYPYESGTFKWYMKQHIDAIKKTGATPVLLTPMCRMFFDSEGKITPHFGDNDGYITAIRQLADEENIMCLDMYNITKGLYESYGIYTTQGLHNIKSDGTIDLTHYNKFGANLIASKMADDIKANTALPISQHIINSSVAVERTTDLKTANLFVVGGTYAAGGSKADYAVSSAGFGDYLQKYLNNKITVKNLAVEDATAKSYADTPQYKTLIDSVAEGDYVVLSFGNDDGKFVGDSYSTGTIEDKGSFAYYMYNNYIKPLTEKKAVIIALTPFADRKFTYGEFAADTFEHTDVITKLVVDNYLSFVNTYEVLSGFYKNMGEEGSKVLNPVDRKNGIVCDELSEFGADLVAKQMLKNLKQSSNSLKDYTLDSALDNNPKMTRADFIVKLMQVLNVDKEATDNFSDVSDGKYYTQAIAKAKALGIVSASYANNFEPEKTLTGEFVQSVLRKSLRFMSVNGNLNDVFQLANGDISPEIGIWAIDRLYEELNK